MKEDKKQKTMSLSYLEAKSGLENLKTFRRLFLLSKDQRSEIRAITNTLEDLVRPTDTEISVINAEYTEVKAHKKYTDDAEAFKKFVAQQNLEIEACVKKNFADKSITFTPVPVADIFTRKETDDFETKEEIARFYPLFLELEDKFLI